MAPDYRIGVIGSGFIVRDVQLVAYRHAGYHVAAICSRNPEHAAEAARLHQIGKVHANWQDLIADPEVDVLDVAVPPHAQPEILRFAAGYAHKLKGVLAQKPFAMNYREAKETYEICARAGLRLGVNQNMRYDQSIRALKSLLDARTLGDPVFATIEMRAIPHWMPWARQYDRLTLLIMSIHHLDVFRHLFGDPESVYASVRQDPRSQFPHRDGVTLYILEYANGLRAAAWDDVWAGPAREGAAPDIYIRWRVEGLDGMARGTIGWPGWPERVPSTLEYTSKAEPGRWIAPRWSEAWFPDAFEGPMGELLAAIAENREPNVIHARGNLRTMALVEACYRSLDLHRPVALNEILEESNEAGTD